MIWGKDMTRKCNNKVNKLDLNLNRLKNNNLKMVEIESILNTLEEKINRQE